MNMGLTFKCDSIGLCLKVGLLTMTLEPVTDLQKLQAKRRGAQLTFQGSTNIQSSFEFRVSQLTFPPERTGPTPSSRFNA